MLKQQENASPIENNIQIKKAFQILEFPLLVLQIMRDRLFVHQICVYMWERVLSPTRLKPNEKTYKCSEILRVLCCLPLFLTLVVPLSVFLLCIHEETLESRGSIKFGKYIIPEHNNVW